jgi:hypothetical protein
VYGQQRVVQAGHLGQSRAQPARAHVRLPVRRVYHGAAQTPGAGKRCGAAAAEGSGSGTKIEKRVCKSGEEAYFWTVLNANWQL